MNKNEQIKQTLIETRLRHEKMLCKVYEVKVVSNKMNRKQKECLNGLFREAKWIRNAYISGNAISDNCVNVFVKDHYEERKLEYIGSQIVESVIKEVETNIKSLHTKKKKGQKVGRLKFKSYCNEVDLKQYGNTYSIDFDHNRIKVQKIKKPFYVRGLKQIPDNAEFANAKLLRKPDGIYFHIVCFIPKEKPVHTGNECGIDFGIEHNLTLSDGTTHDISVPESKGVKLASKRMNKALVKNGRTKGKNHRKRQKKLKIAYQKDKNKRIDQANKVIHNILKENDFIAIQDEMIHNWHSGLFGKQVQKSAMGYIKAKLKKNSKVHVVERSFPSTQICPECGCLTKHDLSKREYNCIHCGYHHDSRDQKSAQSILDEAHRIVSLERRAQSPVEIDSSTLMLLNGQCTDPSLKQEARYFSAG